MIKLSEEHTKFRELMSSFDSANWEYIKEQSKKGSGEKGTFAGMYKTQKEDFDKFNNKLKEWIEDNA